MVSGNFISKTGWRAAIAVSALAIALLLPTQAFGHGDNNCSNVRTDPTAAQYCPPSSLKQGEHSGRQIVVANTSGGNGGPTGTGSSGGSLPFTGLDLALLTAVALALGGTGFALWRFTRTSPAGR